MLCSRSVTESSQRPWAKPLVTPCYRCEPRRSERDRDPCTVTQSLGLSFASSGLHAAAHPLLHGTWVGASSGKLAGCIRAGMSFGGVLGMHPLQVWKSLRASENSSLCQVRLVGGMLKGKRAPLTQGTPRSEGEGWRCGEEVSRAGSERP